MKTGKLVLALLFSIAGVAGAQELASLNGMWHGETMLPGGAPAQVQMRVEGGGGTWTVSLQGGRVDHTNRCLGRPLPIALTETDGLIRIHIQASRVMKDCQDGRVAVRRTDDRHLEGTFADGRPLKLQRR